MNIAVIDDDKIFVENLKEMIMQSCTQNSILSDIDCFYDGESILRNYDKYHLIFLDIDMPVMNGIEVAVKLNILKGTSDLPYIIFVTSKDNLVFEALKQLPYSFIRKSFLNDDIQKCISSICNKLNTKQQRYAIKVGRNTDFIDLNNVLYLEKEKNYVVFHMLLKTYKERTNIDEKNNDLCNKGFLRVHIGYLVNINHISEITPKDIMLDNGVKIPLGKKYKSEVQEKYFDWLVKPYD